MFEFAATSVPCGRGFLSMRAGMTAPISSSCREELHVIYSIEKGREGKAERPFPSEITKTHHCSLKTSAPVPISIKSMERWPLASRILGLRHWLSSC